MQFTTRQKKIISLVKHYEPITSDEIAKKLHVGKSTIRNELAVLVLVGILSAKQKVGYYYNENGQTFTQNHTIKKTLVRDVMGVAITAKKMDLFADVVSKLYVHDVGTIFILDEHNHLAGVVSRKDLLKMAIANPNASTMPVALAMTRIPNVITCDESEPITTVLRRLINHQVDCLPVVRHDGQGATVVGRISKTISIHLCLELLEV